MTDDELKKELKRFLIPKIRSASYRWSERSKAIKNARVERGRYQCKMCGNKELKNGEFVMDHTSPVVPFEGWDGNWDTYINRMFVRAEDFQALCHSCHTMKTESEVQIRKMYRAKKKNTKNLKKIPWMWAYVGHFLGLLHHKQIRVITLDHQ